MLRNHPCKRYARIKYKKSLLYIMTTTAWKCYRCDLTFKEETVATLHKDICNHESRQIRIAVA